VRADGSGVVEIRFGTNGWRGVLGRDFSVEGAERLAHALALALGASGERPRVIVAHDTRAQADAIAARAAAVLAGAGAAPLLCGGAVPTPVAGFLVRAHRAAAGLVVTASHNPPEYLGVKILGPAGEGAQRDLTDSLELAASSGGPRAALQSARAAVRVLAQPTQRYLAALEGKLRPGGARPRVLYDAMHGTGAGVVDVLLTRLGARVSVLRGERDASFGGSAPDPVRGRLGRLLRAVREGGFDFGLATDGDADRFALVDARGRLLSETEALALLVDHVAATRSLRRGLALSVATGSLAERVARAHGLRVRRVGLGFSPLSAALRDGQADVAGEESGGFAWREMGFDKDGILAGALALEAAASEPLHVRLARLRRAHGRSACGRVALPAVPRARRALARLGQAPPRRVGGARVETLSRADGVRVGFADGFLYWRASGTEPVIRVYAEAPSQAALARRLAAGVARLR
jgi:phosphoglucomutase